MSDWRAEFRVALIDEVVRYGSPVSDTASYYGWMDYDWQDKKKEALAVGINYEACTWEESSWDEFQGTFYEGDTRQYGIDLHLVLTNGTTLHWRYAGNAGALIIALTKGVLEA